MYLREDDGFWEEVIDNHVLSINSKKGRYLINMEIKLICDLRENLPSNLINSDINFSDHPPKENILEIKSMVEQCGYSCSIFGGIPELIEANEKKICVENIIFLNLTDGLEMKCGRVQAPILLETLGAFYSGADPFQAALIDNKYYTKLAVKDIGISIPQSILLHKNDLLDNYDIEKMKYPIIVKPNAKGSSIGITQNSICYDSSHLMKLIAQQKEEFNDILVEQFIPGYEIINFIIGNDGNYSINIPILEEFHGNLIHKNEVMAVEDKAFRTRTFHLCSAVLGDKICQNIQNASHQIKSKLKVNDILRIDYRVTENGQIYFLEANTVPRICSKNEAGFICKSMNKPYNYFFSCLLDTVIQRYYKERLH